MADQTVYPLSEPSAVDVAAIESELETLWRNAAHAEEKDAVLHAAAFNLIYAVKAFAAGDDVSGMVVELITAHPSRGILLRIGDENAAPSQQAWVSAYCQRPSPTSPQVCSEFITLDSTGPAGESVQSTLLSLLLSGVPTALIWDNSLPGDHPLLTSLGTEVDRVIVSVIPPCSPASRLSRIFELRAVLGKRPVVTDLTESLLRPWQLAIAQLFDHDPERTRQIRGITLHYSGTKIPAEMLMLAAWMSVSLGWRPRGVTLMGTNSVIAFENDFSILFNGGNKDEDDFVEFRLHDPQHLSVLRCDEPVMDNRLSQLLLLQLQIWGRDPVMDESFARVRLWLKDLLFS